MEGGMIAAWFAARLVPIGAGVAIVVAFVAWDRVRIWNAEARGGEKVAAKIEKATNEKLDRAGSAARKSAAGGGVSSPYYRD
jgi:hypothetical protein